MKRISVMNIILIAVMALPGFVYAQDSPAEKIVESAYWKHRTSQFRTLPNPEGEICFLGDSITDGCEWRELTGINKVTNRGISGDTSWGLMARIDEVTEGKPTIIFMMIGINDLAWGEKTVPEVRDQVAKVLDTIKKQSPETKIYLQSTLPVIENKERKLENEEVNSLNVEYTKLAASRNIAFINLTPFFKDDSGQLKKEFTEDGLHLNGSAYYQWYSVIRKYLPE